MKIKMIFMAALIAAMASGCKESEESGQTPYTPIGLDEQTRGGVERNNEFAFNLLDAAGDRKNPAISPFSVFSSLAMLANGDDRDVRKEILEALGYEESEIDALNSYCRLMNSELPSVDRSTTVRIANSFWYSPGQEIKQTFAEIVRDIFDAGLYAESLNTQSGLDKVNAWVAQKTEGMINNFLPDPVTYDSGLFNVVYFNGKWASKFDAAKTYRRTFRNYDGATSTPYFMNQSEKLVYYDNGEFVGVDLPYGNGNFTMTVIKPTDPSVALDIDMYQFDKLISTGEMKTVDLSLPKFDSAGTIIWTDDDFDRLGISSVAKKGCNAIIEHRAVKLTEIHHGVSLIVDENGTEASAVTGALLPTSSGSVAVDFDSPFIYMIRETSTNTILFLGRKDRF